MVLMGRRDEGKEERDWYVVEFGETAEEVYRAKKDEVEEGRGNFRLFQFFMREVYGDW